MVILLLEEEMIITIATIQSAILWLFYQSNQDMYVLDPEGQLQSHRLSTLVDVIGSLH